MTKVQDKQFQGNALVQCDRLTVDRETNRGGMKEGKRMKRVWNEKRLWIFLVWGLVVSVCGLVTGGIYLNLRTLTSSEKYTEIIPNYVNFISVIIAGIMVLVLFWKRNVILVFACVFVNVGAAFLNGISAILTGTLIIPPINQLLHCTFLSSQKQCHCLSPYSRSFIQLDYSIEEPVTLIFQDTSNCNDIEVILIQILYTLCGLCVVSAITCIISAILALLVLRMERRRKLGYQNSTYDEIFTISNSNTPDSSDSENEQNPNLVRPILPTYSDLERIESDTSSNRLRSSLQRSHSLKAPKTESNNFDMLDNTIPKEKVTKGKLKEHRRRGQRAVTLHNLDSKQLMVILSLQMRYLKENEHSKSQVELSARKLDEQLRRSFTPQPYHSRSKSSESERDVRKIRSHTPQPYKTKKQQMYENLQTANLNEFYENNFPPWERSQSIKAKGSNEKRKSSHIPHYEEIDDIRSYMSGDEDDRIYANQSEVKIQKKKKIKPKIPTDSEESELSDIPPNRLRRSHRKNTSSDLPINIPVQQNIIPNPGRPKSYIKAIDNPDPNPEDLYSHVNKHSPLINHAQSQPNHLNQPEYHNINEVRKPSEGIYAQPVKKMNPKAAFKRIPDSNSVPVINQPNLYQNTVERCSAFQVVHRSSEAGTGIVGYIDPVTRHNYHLYSAMEKKVNEEKPPPYSPPPCYSDCTTTSRDSLSQSSSLSHHSNHSHHTFNQGNKHRPKFVYTIESNPPLLETQAGCSYTETNRNKPNPVHQQIVEPSPGQYRANIDNQPGAFSPPYRANYVINFDNEQPKVLLQGESSDSDEMETVI